MEGFFRKYFDNFCCGNGGIAPVQKTLSSVKSWSFGSENLEEPLEDLSYLDSVDCRTGRSCCRSQRKPWPSYFSWLCGLVPPFMATLFIAPLFSECERMWKDSPMVQKNPALFDSVKEISSTKVSDTWLKRGSNFAKNLRPREKKYPEGHWGDRVEKQHCVSSILQKE